MLLSCMVRKKRSRFLLLLVLPLLLAGAAGCSSGLPGEVTPSEIAFRLAQEPAAWHQQAQQHARLADRFAEMTRLAQPFDSLGSFARSLDLSPGAVIFIGESHASPGPARELALDILARPDAANLVLWEEGEEWWLSPKAPRLRGLLTHQWDAESTPARLVMAGGSTFNRVFAEKAAAGLPELLLVYTGNAHVYFDPELPNPYPPTDKEPLPPDAARDAVAIASSSSRPSSVLSIQTYSAKVFIDRVDLLLAQSIAVAMTDGTLSRAGAIAATNQSISRVSDLREACKSLGSWSAVQSPGVLIVVIENSETRDGVTALSALGHVLTLPHVSDLLNQGWTPRLTAASYPFGPKQGRDASFDFEMVPPKGSPFAPVEITVGRNGPGYTPEELE